ncbi:TIGR04086 family membrane protein [Clostridium carnis]
MEWKNYFKCVLKGVLWSLIVTFLVTALFSIIMNSMTIGDGLFNVIYVVISCVSLVIGSIIAAKSHGSKGWIVGLAVGVVFYISLYLIGVICGAETTLGMYDLIKFGLCILIGTLSGMLGINL